MKKKINAGVKQTKHNKMKLCTKKINLKSYINFLEKYNLKISIKSIHLN